MDSLPLLSWQFAIIQVAAEKVIDPVSYMWVQSSAIIPECMMESCRMVLTFESVNKILQFDLSNESY